MESGDTAERGDDAVVDPAGSDGGVAEVDQRVAAAVERAGGSTCGDGFAGADFAGDDAEGSFLDAPSDPGDGFVVACGAVQHLRCEVAAERHAGESVVGLQQLDAHRAPPAVVGMWSWPGHWLGSTVSMRTL